MIKIFNATQVREIDSDTIKHQGITSLELMERAATNMCECLFPLLTPQQHIYIFAGSGNNGGDALAIARMLKEKAFRVGTFLVNANNNLSPDCDANKKQFEIAGEIKYIRTLADIPEIPENSIIIDGLFGSGLNRPLAGIYKEVVRAINRSGSKIYSIDIPSGLFMDDNTNNDKEAIIKADHVFSFQFPKLSLLMPENSIFCKGFSIVDIGLSTKSIEEKETGYSSVQLSNVSALLKPRDQFSHKGDYGRACIIAGSYGKMGAAVMAARACLRSGAGLLTMHLPRCGTDIIQTAVPEAMVNADLHETHACKIDFNLEKQTIGIGPGIGTATETKGMLYDLFDKYRKPMVIDADALNIISENEELKNRIPPDSILTPHPLEFDRLSGKESVSGYQRLQLARDFATVYNLYIILKGAYSATITPAGDVYFNPTGNPGMARGGSGDVLTGILTALLAQKYSPFETCLLGVYLHGMAGDIASKKRTQYAMLPSDIIECLSNGFEELIRNQID